MGVDAGFREEVTGIQLEDGPMRLEGFAHARLQDRHASGRAQAAAVNDADAAVAIVAAGLEELLHARGRGGGRHAVQVAPIRGGVVAAFQFPDLAPVDARRGEVRV